MACVKKASSKHQDRMPHELRPPEHGACLVSSVSVRAHVQSVGTSEHGARGNSIAADHNQAAAQRCESRRAPRRRRTIRGKPPPHQPGWVELKEVAEKGACAGRGRRQVWEVGNAFSPPQPPLSLSLHASSVESSGTKGWRAFHRCSIKGHGEYSSEEGGKCTLSDL
jgi:hypothetical protein